MNYSKIENFKNFSTVSASSNAQLDCESWAVGSASIQPVKNSTSQSLNVYWFSSLERTWRNLLLLMALGVSYAVAL